MPGSIESGCFDVVVLDQEWFDAGRNRPMPVRIHYPAGDQSLLPVVLFSNGLRGTRSGVEYLGRHRASRGYVSAHLEHPRTDGAARRGQAGDLASMLRAIGSRNTVLRGQDVSFALDQV